MEIKLTAKLDRPGGTAVICGRRGCGGELGAEILKDSPGEVKLWPGYTYVDGVSQLRRHTKKRLAGGWGPGLRRPAFEHHNTGGYPVRADGSRDLTKSPRPIVRRKERLDLSQKARLPALLACPWCGRYQWLRREAFGLPASPGDAEQEKRVEGIFLTRQKDRLG